MARTAATAAALGPGRFDGEDAILAFAGQREPLSWNAASSRWFGPARPAISSRGDWKLRPTMDTLAGTWRYVAEPFGNAGQIGQSSYSWDPFAVRAADSAYTAGLVLQDQLAAVIWNWDPGAIWEFGLIRYAVADGDMISTLAVPSGNVSCSLLSGNGVRKWQTTGWVNAGIPTPTKPTLAPHFYARWPTTKDSRPSIEYVLACWRWSTP